MVEGDVRAHGVRLNKGHVQVHMWIVGDIVGSAKNDQGQRMFHK
jgi:hypothetical protein